MRTIEHRQITDHYDATGVLRVERKGNPFMRSPQGGRLLSAMMLPYFMARPPVGFGVLSTTGRRSAKRRSRCVHVIRDGDQAYIVMIRPKLAVKASAWVLNIRADPKVQLRMRGGTFAGRARELDQGEALERARKLYCEAVNPFDYVECGFHRSGLPSRAKIEELHRSWFETGVPIVVELEQHRP